MKICQILASNEEGGLENHFVDLCNGLAATHEMHVIADSRYAERFDGLHFHAIDAGLGRRNPALLWRIYRLLRKIAPEIIHAHANKATAIIATLRPFLHGNPRLVATLHSQKKQVSAFEKMDTVIGVSRRVIENVRHRSKEVVPIGLPGKTIQASASQPAATVYGQLPGRPLVVAIGRLVQVKRFDILIRAFARLRDGYLLIVGNGELRGTLEELASSLNTGRISFTGHREDVIDILRAADLCVISSEREGFPYVMAEALLTGTPVISTDVSDMREILPAAYVVAVNDTEALQHAMEHALRNPDRTRRDFEECFKWARQFLTHERVLRDINRIYSELAAAR